jgi:hypothetical protein
MALHQGEITMGHLAFYFACFFTTMAMGREKDAATPKPPTFEAPKGWKAVEAGMLTTARFQIGEGDRVATVTVTGLSGNAGGLAPNINRWRSQIGLETLSEKDALAMAKAIKVDRFSGHFIDMVGPKVPDKPARRILAVVLTQGDMTWFFKMDGPSSLVAEQKAAFDSFLKSVRFEK